MDICLKYRSQILFESGRAAFKFDGAWEVNTIYNNYPDVNLGVAPYVVSDNWDGGRYTPTGSWAFAASSKTKKLKGATKLVQWMSGVESGKRLWDEVRVSHLHMKRLRAVRFLKKMRIIKPYIIS